MRLAPSSFTADLARLNALDLRRWVFEEGMSFGAAGAWWGGRRPRPRAHNGLDLRWYENGTGGREALAPGALVPIACAGRVVRVVDDFLGRSLFVDHGAVDGEARLCTAYGHLHPLPGLAEGKSLSAGTAVATVADPVRGAVPAHLHLSALILPASFPPDRLAWESLEADPAVRWLDPMPIVALEET